jgi:hypothetical protein
LIDWLVDWVVWIVVRRSAEQWLQATERRSTAPRSLMDLSTGNTFVHTMFEIVKETCGSSEIRAPAAQDLSGSNQMFICGNTLFVGHDKDYRTYCTNTLQEKATLKFTSSLIATDGKQRVFELRNDGPAIVVHSLATNADGNDVLCKDSTTVTLSSANGMLLVLSNPIGGSLRDTNRELCCCCCACR